VALSDVEKAQLTLKVPEDRLHRIYNGVDSTEFYPPTPARTSPSDDDHWRLLYVGQLIELKRVHLTIRLIADLKSRGIPARLTLVTQRDTLRRELADYARALGVGECLIWLGPRTKPEVAQLMRDSHLLVVPSRTEALSTVVTEACLTALPVAAFKVGGMPEQLPCGMELLETCDTDKFSTLVTSILGNYDSYTTLFLSHSKEAALRFSVQTMVDDHARLYESILSR
jgi:glycosyltransferase involved in cell wall biosynthesis